MDNIISIFFQAGYEESWIILYLIKHKIITSSQIDAIKNSIRRLAQEKFRQQVLSRDKKCIISGADPIESEAAHIIPYSQCKLCDVSNGILLNACLHKLFDNYLFSINPHTLIVCVKTDTNLSINKYIGRKINVAKECIPNLMIHYTIFMKKNYS